MHPLKKFFSFCKYYLIDIKFFFLCAGKKPCKSQLHFACQMSREENTYPLENQRPRASVQIPLKEHLQIWQRSAANGARGASTEC